MSQVLTKTLDRVRTAWDMIERAEPNDTLTVGVALDYVMDGGCSREDAKLELYRHVARLITLFTENLSAFDCKGAATDLSLYLWDGHVQHAKLYISGFTSGRAEEFGKRAKRWIKLCSWVEGVE